MTITIDDQQRRLIVACSIPNLANEPVTVTQHLHPGRKGLDTLDVACSGCTLTVSYQAAAYDELDADERDAAAYRDAADHATAHARVCGVPVGGWRPAPLLTVQLSVHAAATLLFSCEKAVEAMNGEDLRKAIQAEFARCGCNLARAEADVWAEFGQYPETAAAHMRSCVIVASRLLGVAP